MYTYRIDTVKIGSSPYLMVICRAFCIWMSLCLPCQSQLTSEQLSAEGFRACDASCKGENYLAAQCDKAIGLLHRSLQLNSIDGSTAKKLAECMWDRSFLSAETPQASDRDRAEALDLFRNVIARHPDDVDAKYQLSLRAEDSKEKEKVLNELLQQQPDYAPARHDLAILELRLGKHDQALKNFKLYLSKANLDDRESAMVAISFGNDLTNSGDVDDAAEIYGDILQRIQTLPKFEQCNVFQSVNLVALSGHVELVDAIKRLKPYCADISHRNNAVALMAEGKYQGAITELRRQIEVNPQYEETYALLGKLYLQVGDPRSAFQELKRYVEIAEGPRLQCGRFRLTDWSALPRIDDKFLKHMNDLCNSPLGK
jgi:tetratricopeptide (TPR) repeat protein